ncbi:putative 26S proteasome regulatory subunit [Entomophthora muscae]|uniref:26S proteasome regulatory subunit n=1 Tax=Entomophthora muscae TaxID=34485 RepID=A0ACC2TDX7_9FUNG|nr:putative 26S proteasome regulatory subunit [Entomophthora muscae]
MAKEHINHLIEKKEEIEKKLLQQEDILKANKVTMSDSLIDREGFPRGDLDIPTIRSARIQIIRLQNDLKDVIISNTASPFALVNSVIVGSPAYKAGLRQGDQILKFSHLEGLKESEFTKLAEVVQANIDKPIIISILKSDRDSQPVDLSLVPSYTWDDGHRGQSLLGCHIVTLSN